MAAKTGCIKSNLRSKVVLDFDKIGGLSEHLQLLREIIVLPLIYSDIYSHFSIKAPRGLLFYGPPGTGKSLVAGALANELSKGGQGKVQFFSRKGADVLDKYVGESERRLRELFEKAAKHRPSIIFFDELDGLAPSRSQRSDQVHSSVVATLLALMDGLNNTPGVIVIGATNRIDAIDPALRRPGRFDRELYFPIPCTEARKDILNIHIRTWSQKLNPDFISHLAHITAGYTGADLQGLCSEAFLCCLKRLYPNINSGNKMHVDRSLLKVEETDFHNARRNITPWNQRSPCKTMKLSECVKPLLERQLNKILIKLQSIWPHFTNPGQKLLPDVERHIGRVLLLAKPGNGLNLHIVPALLQSFEHLPIEVVNASTAAEKTMPDRHNIPSILLLSRVHDWWDSADDSFKCLLTALLKDMHPSSPLLIICTCDCYTNLPENLLQYFSNNSALVVQIENPTEKEREEFFKPLFFESSIMSVQKVFHNTHTCIACNRIKRSPTNDDEGPSKVKRLKTDNICRTALKLHGNCGRKCESSLQECGSSPSLDICNISSKATRDCFSNCISAAPRAPSHISTTKENIRLPHNDSKEVLPSYNTKLLISNSKGPDLHNCSVSNKLSNYENPERPSFSTMKKKSRSKSRGVRNTPHTFTTPLTELVNTTSTEDRKPCTLVVKRGSNEDVYVAEKNAIKHLFNYAMHVISGDYTVSQLELLYDTISACIYINKNAFRSLLKNLQIILENFKKYII